MIELDPTSTLTKQELKQYVLESGCFSPEENERIYNKWFKDSPRYLFRAVDKKFNIRRKVLCDAGCGYGMNLFHCARGSYGIEIDPKQARFAQSLRLRVYERDMIYDDFSELPRVEVVWSSGVLEHVDSPHIFLRKAHQLLRPGGLLAVHVPTIPNFRFLRFDRIPYFKKYFIGHLAVDHINAFTAETLTFFCERAGFETIDVSPFYPGLLGLLNHIPLFRNMIDGTTYVGRALSGWEYHRRALRRVADNQRGFVRRED